MRRCLHCLKEIDLEVDVYPSHRNFPRPSCIQCVKDAAKMSYYRRKLKAREMRKEAPPHLIEHNAQVIEALARELQVKNLVTADLQITGGIVPVVKGFWFERLKDGTVYVKAKVTERITLTRHAGLTTVSEFSTLLAEYHAKVLYGTN